MWAQSAAALDRVGGAGLGKSGVQTNKDTRASAGVMWGVPDGILYAESGCWQNHTLSEKNLKKNSPLAAVDDRKAICLSWGKVPTGIMSDLGLAQTFSLHGLRTRGFQVSKTPRETKISKSDLLGSIDFWPRVERITWQRWAWNNNNNKIITKHKELI